MFSLDFKLFYFLNGPQILRHGHIKLFKPHHSILHCVAQLFPACPLELLDLLVLFGLSWTHCVALHVQNHHWRGECRGGKARIPAADAQFLEGFAHWSSGAPAWEGAPCPALLLSQWEFLALSCLENQIFWKAGHVKRLCFYLCTRGHETSYKWSIQRGKQKFPDLFLAPNISSWHLVYGDVQTLNIANLFYPQTHNRLMMCIQRLFILSTDRECEYSKCFLLSPCGISLINCIIFFCFRGW